jgi:hypothetical protein
MIIYVATRLNAFIRDEHERYLRRAGHTPILAPSTTGPCPRHGTPDVAWPCPDADACQLREDLSTMLQCDAVYAASPEPRRPATQLLLHVAVACGMRVYYRVTSTLPGEDVVEDVAAVHVDVTTPAGERVRYVEPQRLRPGGPVHGGFTVVTHGEDVPE